MVVAKREDSFPGRENSMCEELAIGNMAILNF